MQFTLVRYNLLVKNYYNAGFQSVYRGRATSPAIDEAFEDLDRHPLC